MSSFCNKCGRELQPGVMFCGGCGAPRPGGHNPGKEVQNSGAGMQYAGASEQDVSKKMQPGFYLALMSLVLPIVILVAGFLIADGAPSINDAISVMYMTIIALIIPLVFGIVAMVKGYKKFLSIAGIIASLVAIVFAAVTIYELYQIPWFLRW